MMGKQDKPPAPAPAPTPADKTPPTPEGGVQSPRDGKFEADHRPSR